MPELVNFAVTTSTKSGPELRADWQVNLASYEKLQIEVEPKKPPLKLKLTSGKRIELLIVAAGPGDGAVKYRVQTAPPPAPPAPTIELKPLPQIVIYRAGMLPSEEELVLEFENTGSKKVGIDVLVGRALAPT